MDREVSIAKQARENRRNHAGVDVALGMLLLILIVLFLVGLIVSGISYQTYKNAIADEKRALSRELLAIARTAAAAIDGDAYEKLFLPARMDSSFTPAAYETLLSRAPRAPYFAHVQQILRKTIAANVDLELNAENIYTLAVDPYSSPEILRWGVMLHPKLFTGEVLRARPDQKPVLRGEKYVLRADSYYSNASNREWISACAAIRSAEGRVVGLVEVARDVVSILAETKTAVRKNLFIVLGNLALGVLSTTTLIIMMLKLAGTVRKLRTEVSERASAQQALIESENKYCSLFNRIADPILIFDQSTYQFLDCNEAVERIYGYSRSEILQMRPFDLHPPEEQEMVQQKIDQKNRAAGNVYTHISKDGSRRTVEILTDTIEYQGRPAWISIVRDVSERIHAERELRKAKEAAEAASLAKSDFLATMSHEIRTPMNGIIGMTELALETELSPEQREFLDAVKSSADSLLTIINDILDFSKIEAGKFDLDPIPFRLHDCVADMMHALAVRAHLKDLELVYAIAPEVPDALVGDPGRLRQILLNLVGNAIKFTSEGEVVVSIRVAARTGQEVSLHFCVADTGIGVPPAQQETIFTAFSQADSSTSRKFGGTGLGLAISSQLVELMGGKIWVVSPADSPFGEETERERKPLAERRAAQPGSAFHFTATFRLQKKATGAPVHTTPVDLAGLPVLIVDDNETNKTILLELLERTGMQPEAVGSGESAVQRLREAAAAAQPFPVILLDQQMPGMDGFTTAAKIKKESGLVDAIIMMLTSSGKRGDAARCRQLGISAYLTKPIKPADLLAAITQVMQEVRKVDSDQALVTRHTVREAVAVVPLHAKPVPASGARSLHILLAEDNPVNQKLAVKLLEKLGHTVRVTGNGREALEAWQQSHFDLILMDMQMPEMDGLEATRQIRLQEHFTKTHVPIIALTANAMQGDRERCLRAGMDAYVSKPMHREKLLEAMAKVMHGERVSQDTP